MPVRNRFWRRASAAAPQCVPLEGAHELQYALRAAGVPTEMVAYPREGHQTGEPAHIGDPRRRATEWFDRYLPRS
jgi:dipeptidyl aminopeptidase/acylaminoacyl peptidase